jgi:hypothetical protein
MRIFVNMKVCTKCKKDKKADCFHKNAKSRDGLHTICKVCRLPEVKVKVKVCSKCKVVKKLTDYHAYSLGRHGVYPRCKECRK